MFLNCGIGERLLRVPWTARGYNQFILKEISTEYSLEGLMLKLKLLPTWFKELTHWKRSWCWENWRQEEKRMTEDEMVGWHHQLNGHELEQAPGVGDRQGSLACCSHGVAKSRTQLRNFCFHFNNYWMLLSVGCSSLIGELYHLMINHHNFIAGW